MWISSNLSWGADTCLQSVSWAPRAKGERETEANSCWIQSDLQNWFFFFLNISCSPLVNRNSIGHSEPEAACEIFIGCGYSNICFWDSIKLKEPTLVWISRRRALLWLVIQLGDNHWYQTSRFYRFALQSECKSNVWTSCLVRRH